MSCERTMAALALQVHGAGTPLMAQILITGNMGRGFAKDAMQLPDSAWDKAGEFLESCQKQAIQPIPLGHELYPARMAAMQQPGSLRLGDLFETPETEFVPVLYVQGNTKALQAPQSAAIVGTRQSSASGRAAAFGLAKAAAHRGIPIVSGLAFGIDSEAHRGCMEGGAPTLAVMAHGLSHFAPRGNEALAREILEKGGALVSEHPPETPPRKALFARRNRIQTALSGLVLIVETGTKGGTIHTGNFARKQGVPLACFCPGGTPEGGNVEFMEKGAYAVQDADSFLQLLKR